MDQDDVEDAEDHNARTSKQQEAVVSGSPAEPLHGTGSWTVLDRVVGQEGEVVAVEWDEVREVNETVCCDESSNTDQKQKEQGIHFVERLEPSSCLLQLK